MKKAKKDLLTLFHVNQLVSALIFIILLIGISPITVYAQTQKEDKSKVVRVGWFDSSYNQKDASGIKSGYSYEYQRKIAAYTGWTYEYIEGSWSDLMDMLISGKIDLLSDVSYTDERSEKMLFSSYAMGTEEYYLYINDNNIDTYNEDYSYFNGKKIGVNKGSVQIGLFLDWKKINGISAEIMELNCTEPESVNMLVNGEIDAYITLDNFVGSDKMIPIAKIGSSDFYFAISKSRPDLLNEINNAMSKIQDENRFYDHDLFVKYIQNVGANLVLNNEEKAWLSDHANIRVGYLHNYLAYCATDENTGALTGALKDYLGRASGCFANGGSDL